MELGLLRASSGVRELRWGGLGLLYVIPDFLRVLVVKLGLYCALF
jgi:hypothetical protein